MDGQELGYVPNSADKLVPPLEMDDWAAIFNQSDEEGDEADSVDSVFLGVDTTEQDLQTMMNEAGGESSDENSMDTNV